MIHLVVALVLTLRMCCVGVGELLGLCALLGLPLLFITLVNLALMLLLSLGTSDFISFTAKLVTASL